MKSVKAISISPRKGMRKKNIESTTLVEGFGLKDDAHGGKWHRQVSFLAQESIETMRDKGLDVVAGNFAENITTEGLDLTKMVVGQHLNIGDTELIISQLGKICHTRCAIYHQAGDCVMPREGIFGVILRGGPIAVGDPITIKEKKSESCGLVTTEKIDEKVLEQLTEHLSSRFSPAFVRIDTVSTKEGGSLNDILEDLTVTQKITRIFILDPAGTAAMALAGLQRSENGAGYLKHDSRLYYCTSPEGVNEI